MTPYKPKVRYKAGARYHVHPRTRRLTMKKDRTITKILTVITLGAVALIVLAALSTPPSGRTTSHTVARRAAAAPPSPRPTAIPTPVVVAAQTLVQQYDANKLAAQQRYTGKVVQTTARITNISSVAGQPYLSLRPPTEGAFTLTSLTCDFDRETPLLTLHNGQQVTVRGTMQDMFITVITMQHCTLVQ